MASEVYFIDFRKKKKDNYLNRLAQFLRQSPILSEVIKPKELVAIKLHFGEQGNVNYVRPEYVKLVSDELEHRNARPFLTDTTTLYRGERALATSHLKLAREHGFDFCPIIIADGLIGENYVERGGVRMAQVISQVEQLVFISHFKGHLLTGFGGALKNIGMGCAAKSGKLFLHSNSKPFIKTDQCNFCLKCYEYCAFDAIEKEDEHCLIDEKKCSGCCGCMSICPEKAISFRWDSDSQDIQKKIARYASEIVKEKKSIYFNFLINITRDCDCFPSLEPKIMEDIGVLISRDPVAIDQAGWDFTKKVLGEVYHDIDPEIQLDEAERLGAGKKDYELKEVA